ncbi:MAG: right-handed parallel beta-helix repeat-containing protein, partial [Planctomycetota bacterium]
MNRALSMALLPVLLVAAILASPANGANRTVRVKTTEGLRRALTDLRPGTTVLIAPGDYEGGHHVANAVGTEKHPIVISGADPKNPPRFEGGGGNAFHLAGCSHVVLSHLEARGYSGNGVNIDDGGTFDTPAKNVTVSHVTVRDTGPRGNHDGLKLSGLLGFKVENCTFEGWGGSGVDMVGCRKGVIEGCSFKGKDGFSQSNAVQMKGGTRDILVHLCYFEKCGHRAINLGGSTGFQYFRPAVGDFEGRDITVAGNRFVGTTAAVAFVTAQSGHVHHNTIYLPEKWVLRILQETRDPRFKPCRGGLFEHNLVIYDARVRVFVNVGPGTDPKSFVFRRNAWVPLEGAARPSLP